MNKYKINITYTFEEELKNIFYYLFFFLKEPNIARKFRNNILRKILTLEYSPERYPKVLNYSNKNIRKFCVNNYVIIYEVNTDIRSSIYITYFS